MKYLVIVTALLLVGCDERPREKSKNETQAFEWATTFCGDISKVKSYSNASNIMRANVVCMDGREAFVPGS